MALVNLLVACALYYAAWWPLRTTYSVTALLKTPIEMPGEDMQKLRNFFGPTGPRSSRAAARAPLEKLSPADEEARDSPRFTGRAAQRIIPGTLLSWLTLISVSVCALSWASGAMVGPGLRASLRRVAAFLAMGIGLAMLIGAAYLARAKRRARPSPDNPADRTD